LFYVSLSKNSGNIFKCSDCNLQYRRNNGNCCDCYLKFRVNISIEAMAIGNVAAIIGNVEAIIENGAIVIRYVAITKDNIS